MYSVYMHKSKINGKIYVGKTNNVTRRWRSRGIEYKPKNGEPERLFWNALVKYGWDSFEHIILEEVETLEEANALEEKYIKLYDSTNEKNGYNVAPGGDGGKLCKEHPRGMKGKHHSKEWRARQSKLMKRLNEEGKTGAVWKNGHPRGMKGKHHSQEFIDRLKSIPPDEHPSAKPVIIEYEDGRKAEYGCLKYLSQDIGVNQTTLIKTIKNGGLYKISPHCKVNLENLKKIDGAKIYYK